jgi:hypothetical protein
MPKWMDLDERDQGLIKERQAYRDERTAKADSEGKLSAEVGDFVFMPGETNPRRFTMEWTDSLQTTIGGNKREDGSIHPCYGDASFFVGREGHCSFSGSLDYGLKKDKLVKKAERKNGSVWFFHHDWAGAGRGVYTEMEFNCWEYVP